MKLNEKKERSHNKNSNLCWKNNSLALVATEVKKIMCCSISHTNGWKKNLRGKSLFKIQQMKTFLTMLNRNQADVIISEISINFLSLPSRCYSRVTCSESFLRKLTFSRFSDGENQQKSVSPVTFPSHQWNKHKFSWVVFAQIFGSLFKQLWKFLLKCFTYFEIEMEILFVLEVGR